MGLPTALHRFFGGARIALLTAVAATVLAGCGQSFLGSIDTNPAKRSAFTSKEYGVKVSPRVTTAKKVPKGGGRYQVGKAYKVRDRWYEPRVQTDYDVVGHASWYGVDFHGRRTANGEVFDAFGLSAAHPTLPLPSYVRVTNLANNRSVVVRVNDRGPFVSGRTIDMSQRAAEMLGYIDKGTANVRIQYVGEAPLEGDDTRILMASFNQPTMMERTARTETRVALAEVPQVRPRPVNAPAPVPAAPVPAAPPQNSGTSAIAAVFAMEQPVSLMFYAPKLPNLTVATAGSAQRFMPKDQFSRTLPTLAPTDRDAGPVHVRIGLGRFADEGIATEFAIAFARLAAVEQLTDPGNRMGAYGLEISVLKPGVTIDDVRALSEELGLPAPVLY